MELRRRSWGKLGNGLSWRAVSGIACLLSLAVMAALLVVVSSSCCCKDCTLSPPSCVLPSALSEIVCFVRPFASPWLFLLLVVLTKPVWTPGVVFLAFRGLPRRIRARGGALDDLLSFQKAGFAEDMKKILDGLPTGKSLAIGLRGGWGSGKSSVLHAWAEQTECCRNVAVVWCDVWENDSEQDLHWAFVEAILAHPKVLSRAVGRYSLRLALARIRWHRWLPDGFRWRMRVSDRAEVDGHVKPVPMRFQESLSAIVLRATRDIAPGEEPLKIVIVLDELDRARAQTAQAAMILVRRALELPGVVAILPFVEEQMRYKVFNPLTVVNADLRETMLAVLLDAYRRWPGKPENKMALLEDGRLWLRTACCKDGAGKDAPPNTIAIEPDKARDQPYSALEMGLLRHYASLDDTARHRVTALFEEKFIAQTLPPGRLGFTHLPELACRAHAVGPLWKPLWGREHFKVEPQDKDLSDALGRMRASIDLKEEIDSIRMTEGYILQSIEVCKDQLLKDWLGNDDAQPARVRFLMSLALFIAGSQTADALGVLPKQSQIEGQDDGI